MGHARSRKCAGSNAEPLRVSVANTQAQISALVIKCDRDNQAKSKNVIGMLTHVVDQTFAWLTGTMCFQQSLGSFPASPAGPQLKLYKQMNSKPCFLLAPGLVWLALAGVWLAPGRALLGHGCCLGPGRSRRGPGQAPARSQQGASLGPARSPPSLRNDEYTETRNKPEQNLGQISAFRSEWEPALRKACFMCMMCIICSFRNWPCRLSGNA